MRSVFVPNKDIHDTILIAHEILSSISRKHKKGEYMTLSLTRKKSIKDLNGHLLRNVCYLVINNLNGSWDA